MTTKKFKLLGQDGEIVFRKLGRFRVSGHPVRGLCESPSAKPPRQILVDSRLDGKERVEVIIHECLHFAGWHLDEEFIKQFASDVADLLEQVEQD